MKNIYIFFILQIFTIVDVKAVDKVSSYTVKSNECLVQFEAAEGGQIINEDGHWQYKASRKKLDDISNIIFLFGAASSEVLVQNDSGSDNLSAIGLRKEPNGFSSATSGRYYATMKWYKSIKTKNSEGVISYVDGWYGDGQNNGDRTLGFCFAEDFQICAVSSVDKYSKKLRDSAIKIFKSLRLTKPISSRCD